MKTVFSLDQLLAAMPEAKLVFSPACLSAISIDEVAEGIIAMPRSGMKELDAVSAIALLVSHKLLDAPGCSCSYAKAAALAHTASARSFCLVVKGVTEILRDWYGHDHEQHKRECRKTIESFTGLPFPHIYAS